MPLPFTALAQFIVTAFDRCDSRPAPKLTTAAEIGNYGERVAVVYLQRRHGYRLLARNYETDRGEIDLICRDQNMLAFVEVRTRAGETFGTPLESIDTEKQRRILAAAHHYLTELEAPEVPHRFDAVGILWEARKVPQCTLVKALF